MRTQDEIWKSFYKPVILPSNTQIVHPNANLVQEAILEVLCDIREVIKTNNLLLIDLRDKK